MRSVTVKTVINKSAKFTKKVDISQSDNITRRLRNLSLPRR